MEPTSAVPMFDFNIMQFVQNNFHNPITDAVFPIITYLGEKGIFWILIAVILLFFKKTRKCGILCLIAMAFCFIFGEVLLKNIICRVRPCNQFPDVALLISRPTSFSFPSGHSGASFAAATTIFVFNKKFGIAALCLAALIGFSRVFLFVHYPTDVIAGALLGILCAVLTFIIWNAIEKKTNKGKRLAK